jgi:hypothetical protein
MKKLCMVLSLAGAMAATNVFASVTTTLLDNQSATTGYSYGDGGEFRAVVSVPNNVDWSAYTAQTSGLLTTAQLTDANSTASSHGWIQAPGTLVGQEYFQTFCIQTAVYFYPGQSYTATTADSITLGTAWLYSKFAAGTLSGYTYAYGSGRMTSAGALQQAIWYFQSQSGGVANSYVTAAETALGGSSAALSESNGAYGVAGFDLTGASGVAAQDQLFIAVPETTTVVAGALLLLPLGASTLRILRRNRMA